MANRRPPSLSRTVATPELEVEDPSDPYSSSFDPASFKVVQLRSLLSEHEVVVPSNARKADLIQAYEEAIRPNLDELRAARNRDRNIRPSADDVTVLKADGYPVFKDGESSGNESDLPPSALLRTGTPRRGRRSVSWAEDVSGPEDDEEADGDASTFSINNPFQSPRPEGAGKKRTARKSEPSTRSASPGHAAKQPRSSTSSLLKNYMDPTIASKTSPRIIKDAANGIKSKITGSDGLKQEEDYDESGMEADISRDAYDEPPSSPAAQKRKRMRSRKHSNLSEEFQDSDSDEKVQKARGIVWFLLIAISLSWWVWYASESRVVGYCDVGRQSNSLLDERIREHQSITQALEAGDEKANVTLGVPMALRPGCLPCPPHAVCEGGALLGCESSDYAIRIPIMAHFPGYSSIVPLSMTSPSCQPDQQKVLLAADLADEIENRLRNWKGHVQCKRKSARFGTTKGAREGGTDIAYALPKDEMYQDLKSEVEKGNALAEHPEDYFRELWNLALEDLHATNRVGEAYRGQAALFTKRGGSGVGLWCHARLVLDSLWHRMRLWLALLGSILLLGQWLRYRYQGNRSRQGQTKELVAATLSKLEEVKRLSNQGKYTQDGGYLSITQLRDDILRNEPSESRKKVLWAGVAKVVESNTNVRTRQAKVKGEWSKVWEWIGALDVKKEISDSKVGQGGRQYDDDANLVNRGNGRIHSAEV